MDNETFALRLASWLSPGVLAQAAEEVARRPAEEGESEPVSIVSNKFSDPRAVGFDRLASDFLAGFRVPDGLIAMARLYRPRLPPAAWRAVRRTRFSGQVSFDFPPESVDGRWTVAKIVAPRTEFRLIQWPLLVLADVVGDLAEYWRSVEERAGLHGVHHEHRAEWRLLAWIDLRVAQAMGFARVGRAGMVDARHDYDLSSIGRFHEAHGALPIGEDSLSTLRLAARMVAKPFHDHFDPTEGGGDHGGSHSHR